MTDIQEAPTITIPQDIIDRDKGFSQDVKRADGSLQTAKERKAESAAELNQFRWEMTVCEFGPQFSLDMYGKAVGKSKQAIHKSVTAWQATLDVGKSSTSVDALPDCAYGGVPHDLPNITTKTTKRKVTPEQAETHTEQRRIADNGEIKAAAIELIAAHFQVSEGTVERHHRDTVDEAIKRLRDTNDVSDMTIDEIKSLLNEGARVLRAEDKLRTRRRGIIQRWMADNRGVSVQEITAKDIDSKLERISNVATKKDISWDDAEEEVRSTDVKYNAAAKEKNEMARNARIAILDLMGASAEVKGAAVRVTKAVKAIEDAAIVITDDERTISVDDLDAAEAAIHLARAALTGNSGTDWDAAMASLNERG